MLKRLALTTLCTLFAQVNIAQYYKADILGEGFHQHTFEMGDDYDGAAVSTLIKLAPTHDNSRAVLYIHGYSDYFFQADMAHRLSDYAYNFYALDLRRYGRSIRQHQTPYDMQDISDYFDDIDSALLTMQREGAREIVLMSHSTGGLITSLYCMQPDSLRQQVDAMILNSPFLDMNMGWVAEEIAIPIVSFLGRLFPRIEIPQGLSLYAQSLHRDYHGEWEFDTDWKPLESQPLTMGWIGAIHRAHRKVQSGQNKIEIPILLMYSDKSIIEKEWSEAFHSADAVLDVKDIAKYGAQLGSQVTSVEIADGVHDLVLSRHDVREELYREMFEWLRSAL